VPKWSADARPQSAACIHFSTAVIARAKTTTFRHGFGLPCHLVTSTISALCVNVPRCGRIIVRSVRYVQILTTDLVVSEKITVIVVPVDWRWLSPSFCAECRLQAVRGGELASRQAQALRL